VNIICSKEILLNGINTVIKAVSSRTTLPILECILISTENNNAIRLTCNNLEMGIESALLEANIINSGSVAINAKTFFEIVRKLPDNNISISVKENIIIIKSGRSEFKIAGQDANDFPRLPDFEKSGVYKISAESFKTMVKQTIFSVSMDESKPVLMGELIEIKDNNINMVALDGFRISFRTEKILETYQDIELIVPSKTLGDLARILSSSETKDVLLYVTDKHALFELEECKIITRLIDGSFLKYENIFTDDYKTIVKLNRHDFLESIERVTVIDDSKKMPIKFKLEEEKIIISSNTEVDTSREEIAANIDGDKLEIAFNPKYLIDALKAIESEKISVQFTTSLMPCIIKPYSEENLSLNAKYLILPLKLKG